MKRGPKNIEEYVARFCALALKTKRIKKLEKKVKRLRAIVQRYEVDFLDKRDDLDFCDGCDEYFYPNDLNHCEIHGRTCKSVCESCTNSHLVFCNECEHRVATDCHTYCNTPGCKIRICEHCCDNNYVQGCIHNMCSEHMNECILCFPKQKKKEQEEEESK